MTLPSIDLLPYGVALGALVVAFVFAALFFRSRRGGDGDDDILGLQHIVTLDSNGWRVLAVVAALGALVMIGSSAAIGIAYWTGLALNAEKIEAGATLADKLTVGVVSFFVLALFLELFSDLGTPLSSGFKQRKNKALARFVMVATVGCILMSLATKWGYYDDKSNVRRVEAVQTSVEEDNLKARKAEAEAIIERLKSTPPKAVLDAQRAAVEENIELLSGQLASAEAALEAIPQSHSTNRLKAGERVEGIANKLSAARVELAAITQREADLQALAVARADLETTNTEIKLIAGRVGTENETAHTPIGDHPVVRVLRVSLHQFLCFLFPLVYFESMAAAVDTRKKEEANAKRRQSIAEKTNTIDVPPENVRPAEPAQLTATGFYEEEQEREAEELDELKRRKAKKKSDPRDNHPASPRGGGYRNGADDEKEAMSDDE
jgi:hypothetical protein